MSGYRIPSSRCGNRCAGDPTRFALTEFPPVTMMAAMSASRTVPRVDDFNFHCLVDVRFRDLDAMGHVNNAAYLTFFEVARSEYMRALGHAEPDAPMAELFPFILAEVSCRYLAPASLGDRLRVYLRTTRFGTKSFEFEYLIGHHETGAAIAFGRSQQVYFDYAVQQTLPVPATFRSLVERLEERSLGASLK
jgi:acyl-CoA thioester hydrolase